jgi:hypothetical protein
MFVNGEWQRSCGREHLNLVSHHLDSTGGQIRILVTLRAHCHRTGNLDAVFMSERMCHLWIAHDNLHNA